MAFQYVRSVNRYRDSATGRYVSRATVLDYVERIAQAGSDKAAAYAALVANGELSAADFGLRMRAELKQAYIQEYILGRGGRDAMTPSDWGAIGAMLRKEYNLLNGFVADIEAGNLSEAQIRARANLYFMTARQAYERGNARAHGVPTLPAYGRDGSTECHSMCGCYWRFEKLDGDGNVDCFWEIDPTLENCETCLERSAVWYPLQVRNGVLLPYIDVRVEAHAHVGEHHHG